MAVIGIITNKDNIIEEEEELKKYDIDTKNIIIINEKSIENFKNIKFDILVIYEKITVNESIKKIIKLSKYLIINTDYIENIKLLDEQIETCVITFGFNSKATVTIVSNENEEIILSVQREIINLQGNKIECMEIKMKNNNCKNRIYKDISMKILTILVKI